MARPSATCFSACDRFGERIDRADVRAHPAADQMVAQFVLVAGELVGGHILKLKAHAPQCPSPAPGSAECGG